MQIYKFHAKTCNEQSVFVFACAHAGVEPVGIRPCRELYRIKIIIISNESPYSHQPQYTRAHPK